jgi:hypothetical protein
MEPPDEASRDLKRMYGWIGIACWLLILPVKVARRFDMGISPEIIGVAPNLLGPAGLMLVILSNERRFARLTTIQAGLMAGIIALGLEFAQILPGVRRIYRFDWLDVAATLCSLCAGALISVGLRVRYRAFRG